MNKLCEQADAFPSLLYYNDSMSRLWKKTFLLILGLLFTSPDLTSAVDLGYQGSHILTHGTIEELARAFQKKYGIFLFVKGGGCADGIAAVGRSRYEMGGLCCPLPPDKGAKFRLKAHRVGSDIKTVITHPTNPIRNLTLKQISDIHNGIITNWKQVGGKDRPIALIFRDHCRDMDEPVRRVLGITGPVAKKAIIVKTDKEVVEYVERFPGAVGIAPGIFAHDAKVSILTIDGFSPTPENAEQGVYPLIGDMYIITKEPPDDATKKFIEFVLSPEGQAIVGKKFGRVAR